MSASKKKGRPVHHHRNGLHNFLIQSSMTTIKKIAACARKTCATGLLSLNPYSGMGKLGNRLKKGGDRIRATPTMGRVLKNIVSEHGAVTHALSGVVSGQELATGGNARSQA